MDEADRDRAHLAWRRADRIRVLSDRVVSVGRFGIGIDAVLSWVPVAGTAYSVGAAALLFSEAMQAGASRATLLKMGAFLGIDSVSSAVPVLGWAVDTLYRGHAMAARGEASLTGEFTVGGTGRVSLPLIGEVDASGLTARDFQSRVEAALKDGYLKEPRVSVEVLSYRPFYILGEVTKPGEYPYTNGLTVLNAVATAEGFTYRANKNRVFIKRADGEKEEAFPLTGTTKVAPGDTIRIGERFF